MTKSEAAYRAIVSSDWSECLAPCGPFDVIAYNYPNLESELTAVFRLYTGNSMSLGEASHRIRQLLPKPITIEQMDEYLNACFTTYPGIPELIEWCIGKKVLFMINTTNSIAYFQRVFAKGLLPPVPVLSANPMIRFPKAATDPPYLYDLFEIEDKWKNTEKTAKWFGIDPQRVVVIGDSGGDGPHFEWAMKTGAFLVGSMTKPSLQKYCREKAITIDFTIGPYHASGEQPSDTNHAPVNFMALVPIIEEVADR